MALTEAQLALRDLYREADQRELTLLPDPCLCPTDIIALSDGWQGVVREINLRHTLEDQAVKLVSQVRCWRRWAPAEPHGDWDQVKWNQFSWG